MKVKDIQSGQIGTVEGVRNGITLVTYPDGESFLYTEVDFHNKLEVVEDA